MEVKSGQRQDQVSRAFTFTYCPRVASMDWCNNNTPHWNVPRKIENMKRVLFTLTATLTPPPPPILLLLLVLLVPILVLSLLLLLLLLRLLLILEEDEINCHYHRHHLEVANRQHGESEAIDAGVQRVTWKRLESFNSSTIRIWSQQPPGVSAPSARHLLRYERRRWRRWRRWRRRRRNSSSRKRQDTGGKTRQGRASGFIHLVIIK